MTLRRCVVLLRGVNVGRGNRLAMDELRAAVERAGGSAVSTYVNSGNAVATAEPEGLAERVERELPLAVRVVVRTADELRAVVDRCPFSERAEVEPKHVHVAFLGGDPAPAALAALGTGTGGDALAVGPRVLYLSYAGRSIDSELAHALSRADLGVVVTVRNWTTVTRLVALTG